MDRFAEAAIPYGKEQILKGKSNQRKLFTCNIASGPDGASSCNTFNNPDSPPQAIYRYHIIITKIDYLYEKQKFTWSLFHEMQFSLTWFGIAIYHRENQRSEN